MNVYTTRRAAEDAGAKTYFTGAACASGHVAPRYTVDRGCKQCKLDYQKRLTGYREPLIAPDSARARALQKWNASTKGYAAKMRWKDKDPKNAWACSAVGGAKARAAKRGVAFDLDKEYVRGLIPDECPVFKVPFVFFGRALGPWSPSLDRIDPTRGYIKGNVAVISLKANVIKSDATISEIQTVLDWLRSNS